MAFGMARWRDWFPVDYFAPAIGAGWYFLASYHSYYSAVGVQASGILGAVILYLALLGIFQIVVFIALRYFVRPLDKRKSSRRKA